MPAPGLREAASLVIQPQGRDARQTSIPSNTTRQDFSLVLGGPLFQLLRRTYLSGDALELLQKRVFFIVALVWLPLLTLSALDGQAWAGRAAVPFLYDFEANVRLLVAVPLFIVAEVIVHHGISPVVRQFVDRRMLAESALPRFDAAIASAYRLRNSVLAEVLLIACVYIVGVALVWRHFVALSTSTWYATPTAEGPALSVTGWWYACVSLPVFQFLLLRWYYRILIWVRFLWQVSRIELSLIPTHPDRFGGLGFLPNVAYAFAPLAVAHGAMLAGLIANRIFYVGATLPDFKAEIGIIVVLALSLVFGPFLVFAARLWITRQTGLREYGTLAERYVREFDNRWLRGGAPAEEPLVGSADIQSLADLDNSFEIVKSMRLVPATRTTVMFVVAATLAPVLPLLLTMMSLEELLKKSIAVLF